MTTPALDRATAALAPHLSDLMPPESVRLRAWEVIASAFDQHEVGDLIMRHGIAQSRDWPIRCAGCDWSASDAADALPALTQHANHRAQVIGEHLSGFTEEAAG